MTKDSAKALMDNPALKLVVLVVTVVSSAWGAATAVLSRIDKIDSKLDQVIAVQDGRDDVQDVYSQQNAEEIKDLKRQLEYYTSQPAMKPKGTIIKSEDAEISLNN